MKAFILAAGMGTRLRPYTEHTPKPLFPVAGRPLIDRIIRRLEQAGFTDIAINLHHLGEQIEQFVERQGYRARIKLLHEPQILGTGGGIKNLGNFWRASPLLVINSDILTDIDLKALYDDHVANHCQATLAVLDRSEFNTVTVDAGGHILAFSEPDRSSRKTTQLAFTGIQVIEPAFVDFTPDEPFFSSIDVYRAMIKAGRNVRAYRVRDPFWEDLGTPRRYLECASQAMAREAFTAAFGRAPVHKPVFTKLKGDGSDRRWYRVTAGSDSLVAVAHGIRPSSAVGEADAFVHINRHLNRRGLPVPRLYAADPFSGLAFMEDLGNRHLQDAVLELASRREQARLYCRVIDRLVDMSQKGARGFDPAWAYQTAAYDRQVILEHECGYFVRAFLHLKMELLDIAFATLEDEFKDLADKALENGINGFMHRDCQSRNIMLRGGEPVFIDCQGGRSGPFQYDLASLLIDPYVDLAPDLQAELRDYAMGRICTRTGPDERTFLRVYRHCRITRNLQILGAFSFLSIEKGKTNFADYIPPAVAGLKRALSGPEGKAFPKLRAIVAGL